MPFLRGTNPDLRKEPVRWRPVKNYRAWRKVGFSRAWSLRASLRRPRPDLYDDWNAFT